MFGNKFRVIKDFKPIYKRIGDFEVFYAYEKNGKLEYEIIDDLFGQPSPANWDKSSYAKLLRSIVSSDLQRLIDENIIEILED